MIGQLRETQVYVRSLERGLTLFDLPADKAAQDLAQWGPILQWMKPVLIPPVPQDMSPRDPSRVPARMSGVLAGARPHNAAQLAKA
jgi:chromosome partitioning protein